MARGLLAWRFSLIFDNEEVERAYRRHHAGGLSSRDLCFGFAATLLSIASHSEIKGPALQRAALFSLAIWVSVLPSLLVLMKRSFYLEHRNSILTGVRLVKLALVISYLRNASSAPTEVIESWAGLLRFLLVYGRVGFLLHSAVGHQLISFTGIPIAAISFALLAPHAKTICSLDCMQAPTARAITSQAAEGLSAVFTMYPLASRDMPPPPSLRESQCAVLLLFFQATIGCLLPTWIFYAQERQSRLEFATERGYRFGADTMVLPMDFVYHLIFYSLVASLFWQATEVVFLMLGRT